MGKKRRGKEGRTERIAKTNLSRIPKVEPFLGPLSSLFKMKAIIYQSSLIITVAERDRRRDVMNEMEDILIWKK